MRLIELIAHCDRINGQCSHCIYKEECINYEDENIPFKCLNVKGLAEKVKEDIINKE